MKTYRALAVSLAAALAVAANALAATLPPTIGRLPGKMQIEDLVATMLRN